MMNNKYPLKWLDNLILERLNPNVSDAGQLSESDLALISEDLEKESKRIRIRIKNEIFALHRKRQIRLQVRKYHSMLIFLLDAMADRRQNKAFDMALLSECCNAVMSCLDGLLSFLEQRYANYLSMDERVPVTYLMVLKKEMRLKAKSLQKLKAADGEIGQVLDAVTQELASPIALKSRSRVTFRQMLYERTLLNELLRIGGFGEGLFSFLDQKLIALNFNSAAYIHLLARRIGSNLEKLEGLSERSSQLGFYYKEFAQIHSNEKLFFSAELPPLKSVMENWFAHELSYLEKQIELATASDDKQVGAGAAEKHENKVECDLSADQIGIILRAADEARVVKSRSMSLVFQRIVPHLSTAFKRDLSYQSVRSKSYNAEENDKNIAILTLEKMIKKIRSY
ncbi:hypothetical protein [Flavobacterium tistrianum]|uniref:hypothetical protein n=1 Tax=Flavobacterium tistrianum TaxID=1685414 RepID=UPI0013A640BD|nr:hypothetical protein [Flavobacterium tistrianum]KAF2342894.1 hypothetical protein DMB71_01470 [Flavobacterium tistrianum]